MTSDKKPAAKKPKFSPYWIYAIAIGLMIVFNIFNLLAGKKQTKNG